MNRDIISRVKKYSAVIIPILAAVLLIESCSKSPDGSKPLQAKLRAPSYPLITIDPYTSAWSNSDTLYSDAVRHWTGKIHSLIGALRVDDKSYRFLGKEILPWEPLLPTAAFGAWDGKFILSEPGNGWEKPDFDDSSWESGKGAFGTNGAPALSTLWETGNIWIRREFTLNIDSSGKGLYLVYSHDDTFELWLNGEKLVGTGYEWKQNVVLPISYDLLRKDGKNVIAAHCENKTGGGLVDFGIFREAASDEILAETALQKSVTLSATRTRYSFACGPVDLHLTFTSPLIPEYPDLLSRPVNYISWEAVSNDGNPHKVQIYFDATPEWAVDRVSQEVDLDWGETESLLFLKTGTTEQNILGKKGDDRRIDWGYFYLCSENLQEISSAYGSFSNIRNQFLNTGKVDQDAGEQQKRFLQRNMPVLAFSRELDSVGSAPVTGKIMVAYDDLWSIQYFGENLQAWWKKDGKVTIEQALESAHQEYEAVMKKCEKFDNRLWNSAVEAGGEKYAEICALALRQSVAAHKLLKDKEGNILFFSKENFSNGSIGTVDVTYPSAPLFLLYNPDLLKGMMNPIFYFSESGKWTKPFAAHDVGTYPLANGQTYGADMPVEECGNMLILTAAIAEVEGNASYAEKHWDQLTVWADYLLQHGLDPENQLCTDDFAGHFAHNTNLSIKAIMGIAGYGKLASMLGKKDIAEKYSSQAREMAIKWIEMANDGDHYRLTFDQSGTWSQKYNLVWDKMLGLNIFPPEVAAKEISHYLTRQNAFGLPLDNRKTYTKSDWVVWSATLAEGEKDFLAIIDPLHRYVSETPTRVPMSDWYETTDAKKVGFQARSVVGGYFIKMLEVKLR